MGKADLHIHSNASDGEHTPQALILKVQEKNLQNIAITDHDTIKGYQEAKALAADAGIELISGVELSLLWESREIHILAYAFDDENRKILEL
ncbi:MAG: PHP domain-containing protein, partial [Bacteroidetes bacterium]|nr:PHP domain-containing protein [Bacteroidota bacterium]